MNKWAASCEIWQEGAWQNVGTKRRAGGKWSWVGCQMLPGAASVALLGRIFGIMLGLD